MRNKTKIINAFKQNGSRIKRLRKPERSDVDEALLKWFKQQRSDNVPVSGPLLMVKAEEFAKKLKDEEFVCGAGWTDKFKLRHNITFGKVSGAARGVNTETTTEWLTAVWPSIRKGYADKDIFNADETGIFFRLTPDRTLKFKGEKSVGGKLSKERITALVCANATGSEKRKLLVIGKSKNPRCFKNVENLPVRYSANKKSWMTSSLFEAELRSWDRELQTRKRKIILLVDNCPAHPVLQNLEKIKLVFIPANTTSVLQPMDQGVIRNLKCHYRKLILLRIVESIEKKQDYTVTLLDAIRFIEKAWRRVTTKTIQNCFRHAGILSTQGLNGTENEDDTNNDDDLPLTEWLRKVNCDELGQYDYEAYATIDDNIVTTEAQTDDDIVSEVKKDTEEEDEEGGEECSEVSIPTVSDALEAIRVVNLFYESRGGSSEIVTKIMDIERNLESVYWASNRKQMKITDYCNTFSVLFCGTFTPQVGLRSNSVHL
ncbi:tigger transposable element-derived protein 4-like [Cryptotermes secundus]|uniref:tigger transposable element-derived protein 4-like n=1 Tax=Cryptotermes secundus TaxID=105785 RepID=UPI000CD7B247|nr:tigger transposable element-derived protein 4-like [Cryptotermes secundus]